MTRRLLDLLRWAVPAAALLLAACAAPPPSTRVVLLPQDDGSPSAVVISTAAGQQRLDKPYERASVVAPNQPPRLDNTDAAAVQAQNPALFSLRPPRPRRFVLFFDTGGTRLATQSQRDLDALLSEAAARPGADLVITGHTDTRGATAPNDALSLARAQMVRQMLIQRGFAPERIEAAGRGEREPAVPTADEVDEPRNRRVVVDLR
ncbi:OmpA family protein [Pseudacidovorax sp. RU35E]|uniref:OmpA family protein n=1 Tax=Pseudacidovorax sp. RU35E TaxID=1907403 RepID=UPI0009542C58|nr:OmpA family protein [Pseudacidovorax sp. RU35E]SIR15689.1 OmpA family protein [Pseudacidovorax sp. RU35E]